VELQLSTDGIIATGNHDWNKAITIYTELIRREPNNGFYDSLRARAFYMIGSYDRAIEDYTRAIDLLDKKKEQDSKLKGILIKAMGESYSGRGACWCKKGDYTRSASDFETAHALGIPLSYYFDRAECYREKGEYNRALVDYEKSLRISPGDRYAINGYETTLKLQIQEARKQYDLIAGNEERARQESLKAYAALRPGIHVHQLEVKPKKVPAKSGFDLFVVFSVWDPSEKTNYVPVTFRYEILEGERVLFNSKSVHITAPNGERAPRVVHLSAADKSGTYKIRVQLKHRNKMADETAVFAIE
jgi:hypothetical protein